MMKIINFKCLLNQKYDNIVLINYLEEMVFDLCITTLYEICECAKVIYAYLRFWWLLLYNNNKTLECRTVKIEGSFRANVVEGLASNVHREWVYDGLYVAAELWCLLGMANACEMLYWLLKSMWFIHLNFA